MAESSRTLRQQQGDRGETLVCAHLQAQGWQILAQQWRCRWGELDVVARKGSTLAFIEVKTRGQSSWDASGRLSITCRKQQKLIRAAMTFLNRFPQLADLNCRFDVALIQQDADSEQKLLDYNPAAFEVE